MSDYLVTPVAGLHDRSNGSLVGFLGADGKEYLIGLGKIPGGSAPQQVAVCAIPFVIPPGDGASVGLQFTGTAGAFTLSAAILTGAWNVLKACWMYMPASFGGSAYPAGWYFAVFSSDTAGILYTDTYSSGVPGRQATPTAFPSNLSGWLTTTTSEITGPNGFILRGGSMGPSGMLKTHLRVLGNVTANKTYKIYLDSSSCWTIGPMSTSPHTELIGSCRNQGVENLQLNSTPGSNAGVGLVTNSFQTPSFSTINTATDKTLSISLQISTTAACIVLLHADITVTYGA